MNNYKVQRTGDWADTPSFTNPGTLSGYMHSTYEIVETSTQQVIKNGLYQTEANRLCQHLNSGGFFDGFTPEFFLKPIPYCED